MPAIVAWGYKSYNAPWSRWLLKFTILHCTAHGNRNYTCISSLLDSYKFINLPLQFFELNLDRILRVGIYSRMVVRWLHNQTNFTTANFTDHISI